MVEAGVPAKGPEMHMSHSQIRMINPRMPCCARLLTLSAEPDYFASRHLAEGGEVMQADLVQWRRLHNVTALGHLVEHTGSDDNVAH